MKNEFTISMQSPPGFIEIRGTKDFIISVNFKDELPEDSLNAPDVVFQCKEELEEYFSGKRKEFTVALEPNGTDFQKKIWNELLKVAYGDTASYMDIAKRIKNPAAARAVGLANGKNPIAIIIPCHRVIGDDSKLTGYAGGLWRKQWLLEHEGNTSGKRLTLF